MSALLFLYFFFFFFFCGFGLLSPASELVEPASETSNISLKSLESSPASPVSVHFRISIPLSPRKVTVSLLELPVNFFLLLLDYFRLLWSVQGATMAVKASVLLTAKEMFL